jgi:hypothetical protein
MEFRVLETLRDWEKGLTRLARFFCAAFRSNAIESIKKREK